MLVEFKKRFIKEGEVTLYKTKGLFRKRREETKQKIYRRFWVHGICDESEVDTRIEELLEKELARSSWEPNFSGWLRVVPLEELPEVCEREGWVFLSSTYETFISYFTKQSVHKAFNDLTVEQFVQVCKEAGFDPKEVI